MILIKQGFFGREKESENETKNQKHLLLPSRRRHCRRRARAGPFPPEELRHRRGLLPRGGSHGVPHGRDHERDREADAADDE